MKRSHAQTRATLRIALAFIAAAAGAAVLDDSRWLALHLLLAGALLLAISAVSLMLTVTWSAAPAPPDRWVGAQRLCIAVGAAGVGVARRAEWPDVLTGVAGAVLLSGLVLLAALLVVTVRRGVERRFDVAVASYVAAISAGLLGVAVGVSMAVSDPSTSARAAHVTANALGLVGLVIGGTMPFFAATVVRSRMSPRATPRHLVAILIWQATAVAISVAALWSDAARIAALALAGYALGVLAVVRVLPSPTRRQLQWAGPRLVALWAGGFWWALAVGATAVDVSAGRSVLTGRWLLVLVIVAYVQILWGSLAYLLPMLRGGGPQRLSDGFAATRSWLGLAAVNLAGVALVAAWPSQIVTAAVAVWALDSTWRLLRVGTSRAERPG